MSLRAARRQSSILLAAILTLVSTVSVAAQSPFSFVKWRSIGPVNTSGRIDDFAVARVRGEPDAIYVATASGGVFKSTNGGISWQPIFDNVDAMMAIGAIAVAPSSPSTVWLGTGEPNTRQSTSWGDGVYRSTDAGKTWTNMGLKDTRHIGRVVIDPTDPNIVYVAAQGHLWGPNADRGVFKTTDAGRTWRKVLFIDENTGANDLVIDPGNPQILYASSYQRQRRTWGFNGGGPGSGIHKTTDGGATWTKLTNGLPPGDMGRIGLAIYANDARVVYATIEAGAANAPGSGLYRTLDAGATWEKMSALNTRPNYYSQVRIDPRDRDRIYVLGSNRGFYFSNDGGRTFTELFSNVHGEDHALWVDPDNTNHLVLGGDGGVSISWDRGRTWDFRRNMPLGQFYELDVDDRVPFTIGGGLQDNGVWCVPSGVRNRNGIADRDAWNIGGGDGFHAHFDPTNKSLVLQESQNGNLAWVNIETLERQGVRPGTGDRPALPTAAGGRGGAGAAPLGGGALGAYRWNWDTPIVASKHDPRTWFTGAQVLFKSTDKGSSWTRLSGDLTLGINRDTLRMMGKVVPADALSRHDGQGNYGSLTSIGESPVDAKVLWTGSDDGQVQVTRDGGKTWANVTSKIGVPAQTYVSTVLPSRFKAGRTYVTFDGHYTDDYKPYVFVTEDFGETWRSLSAGLPETGINRMREHPRNPRVLVLAHERGVHFSNDGGATWVSLATNMPTVSADDAVFHERDNALVIGTHGRGIWVLDDVGPLETLTAEAMNAEAVLLPIPRTRLMVTFSPQAWYGHGEFFAPNPEWNAVISYHLRAAASGAAEITVSDGSGKVIRSLRGPAAKGVNRLVWDLRYDAPVDTANMPAPGGRGGGSGGGGRGGPPGVTVVGFPAGGGGGGRGGAPVGPLVLPGRYAVSVRVPGHASPLSGSVAVESDPIARFSDADRLARQAILMRVHAWTKALGETRTSVRALVAQRDSLKADLVSGGSADAAARADSLNARVARLSGEVDRALNAVTGQRGPIEAWSGLPSADQQAALGYAMEDARAALQALNALVGTDIPQSYRQVAKKAWGRPVKGVVVP